MFLNALYWKWLTLKESCFQRIQGRYVNRVYVFWPFSSNNYMGPMFELAMFLIFLSACLDSQLVEIINFLYKYSWASPTIALTSCQPIFLIGKIDMEQFNWSFYPPPPSLPASSQSIGWSNLESCLSKLICSDWVFPPIRKPILSPPPRLCWWHNNKSHNVDGMWLHVAITTLPILNVAWVDSLNYMSWNSK